MNQTTETLITITDAEIAAIERTLYCWNRHQPKPADYPGGSSCSESTAWPEWIAAMNQWRETRDLVEEVFARVREAKAQ